MLTAVTLLLQMMHNCTFPLRRFRQPFRLVSPFMYTASDRFMCYRLIGNIHSRPLLSSNAAGSAKGVGTRVRYRPVSDAIDCIQFQLNTELDVRNSDVIDLICIRPCVRTDVRLCVCVCACVHTHVCTCVHMLCVCTLSVR